MLAHCGFENNMKITKGNITEELLCAMRVHLMNETEMHVFCPKDVRIWDENCHNVEFLNFTAIRFVPSPLLTCIPSILYHLIYSTNMYPTIHSHYVSLLFIFFLTNVYLTPLLPSKPLSLFSMSLQRSERTGGGGCFPQQLACVAGRLSEHIPRRRGDPAQTSRRHRPRGADSR